MGTSIGFKHFSCPFISGITVIVLIFLVAKQMKVIVTNSAPETVTTNVDLHKFMTSNQFME